MMVFPTGKGKGPFYTFDYSTGEMFFDRENPLYEMEKKVYAQFGIDIDSLTHFDAYHEVRLRYRHELRTAFAARIRKKEAVTLDQKARKALLLDDIDEYERLDAIRKKAEAHNLKTIK